MERRSLIIILILMLGTISLSAGAKYVTVVDPYNYTVYNNQSINIGNVGPGQTIYISVSSETTNNTGFLFNYGWNNLDASNLPSGWIAENSSLNNQYLSTRVSVAPNSPDGTYSFNLTAVNTGNYSKLGTVRFTVFVNVTPNVFSINATPSTLYAGPGQPADIKVTFNNTGVSDSPFIISVAGLPAWNSTSTVIALHHTSGKFTYPVYENEPGVYHLKLYVNSTNSKLISRESNLTLVVQASLANDYAALGSGTVIYPITYAPVYAVMYIIDLIAKLL